MKELKVGQWVRVLPESEIGMVGVMGQVYSLQVPTAKPKKPIYIGVIFVGEGEYLPIAFKRTELMYCHD